MCIYDWLVSASAANFGALLTGVGTVGLAIGAVVQLRAWRKQQVVTRKAEVAGESLVVAIRLFQALDLVTSVIIDTPEDAIEEAGPQRKSYRQRRDFTHRMQVTKDDLERFFQMKNKAEVYLPAEVNEALDELWKEWISVKVDIGLHLNFLDMISPPVADNMRAYDNSYGRLGKERREALQLKIKGLLSPIARLE